MPQAVRNPVGGDLAIVLPAYPFICCFLFFGVADLARREPLIESRATEKQESNRRVDRTAGYRQATPGVFGPRPGPVPESVYFMLGLDRCG